MVLHHVDGGGGGLVARDGRDGVGPGRDDYGLVVILQSSKSVHVMLLAIYQYSLGQIHAVFFIRDIGEC